MSCPFFRISLHKVERTSRTYCTVLSNFLWCHLSFSGIFTVEFHPLHPISYWQGPDGIIEKYFHAIQSLTTTTLKCIKRFKGFPLTAAINTGKKWFVYTIKGYKITVISPYFRNCVIMMTKQFSCWNKLQNSETLPWSGLIGLNTSNFAKFEFLTFPWGFCNHNHYIQLPL